MTDNLARCRKGLPAGRLVPKLWLHPTGHPSNGLARSWLFAINAVCLARSWELTVVVGWPAFGLRYERLRLCFCGSGGWGV